MPRPNNIWFRKSRGWWCVTLNGKKLKLAEGRKNRQAALDKYHELMHVRAQAPESPTATVADIVEAFLGWAKKHLGPDTVRGYVFYGQKFAEGCGQIPVADFRPYHVTRWVDSRDWGEGTVYNGRRTAFRVFSWACEEGMLERNPLKGMKRPKPQPRQRALADDEYKAMIRATDSDFRLLLFALRETGARPKEVRELTWDQVREDRWVLKEHKTAKKTRKPRIIYLTKPMQKLMPVLRRRSKSKHVFLNSRGGPWTMNAVRLRVMRLKKKLSLADDVCSYLVRHAFGTKAIVNGVDPLTVAELMGHTSLEMVSTVYVHLAEQHQHLQGAVEKAVRRVEAPVGRDGIRAG